MLGGLLAPFDRDRCQIRDVCILRINIYMNGQRGTRRTLQRALEARLRVGQYPGSLCFRFRSLRLRSVLGFLLSLYFSRRASLLFRRGLYIGRLGRLSRLGRLGRLSRLGRWCRDGSGRQKGPRGDLLARIRSSKEPRGQRRVRARGNACC